MEQYKKTIEEISELFTHKKVKDIDTSIELVNTQYELLVELFDSSNDEDKLWACRYAITSLLPLLTRMLSSPKIDEKKIANVYAIYKRTYAFASRRSLSHFIDYMEWDRSSSRKVYANRKEILDIPIFYLNKMTFDENLQYFRLSLPPGYGKCVEENTEIYTPNGLIKIKDLNVGDKVYSMKNKKMIEETVLAKENSVKSQVKINTQNGRNIIVSEDHHMLTLDGYKKASEITERDYLYSVFNSYDTNLEISDDEIIFISSMIFEGHCKFSRYSFTGEENEMTINFLESCKNLGISVHKVNDNGSNGKANSYRLHTKNGVVERLLEKYKINNHLCYTKRLPKEFFMMSKRQKFLFISVMFATDGYISKEGDIGITLANEKLIDDIQLILSLCGIYSTKSKKYNKKFDKYAWKLTISRKSINLLKENCYLYHKNYKVEAQINLKPIHSCFGTRYPRELFKDKIQYAGNYDLLKMERKTDITIEMFERWVNYYPELEEHRYEHFYWQKIKSVEHIEEEVNMVDIQVSNQYNFIANGYVSHNSFLGNYYSAWIFGIDMNYSILRLSSSDEVVMGFSRAIKDLIISEQFSEVFPNYKVFNGKPFEKEKDSDWKIKGADLITSHLSRTRQGTTVGVRAKFGIIFDDMTKGAEEANNDDLHKGIYEQWNTEWINRKENDKVKYIFLGTMWNPNDLLNKIKEDEEKVSPLVPSKRFPYVEECEDGHAVFITIPQLDENDNSTCEVVMSTVKARRLRDNTDDFLWSCVYQQKPIAPSGREFANENIRKYDELPKFNNNFVYAVLDPTRRGKDNISMPIFIKSDDGEEHYLIDWYYKKVAMTDAYDDVIDMILQHKITHYHIENNTDTSLVSIIEMKLRDKGYTNCEVTEIFNTVKKEVRIKDARGMIKKKLLFKQKSNYAPNSMYGKAMEALTTYSFDYANKNDDAPDSLALYVNKFILEDSEKVTITPIDRRMLRF